MSVTKASAERYTIRNSGEFASICLTCWSRPVEGEKEPYYCGEIQIHSSYGSWGNIWTACARPFKQFLIGADFDYVFTKFMGEKLRVFDGPSSIAGMQSQIIELRRQNSVTSTEARDAWNALELERDEAECGEICFGYAMQRISSEFVPHSALHQRFGDPMEWARITKYDRSAEMFWKVLWPEFCAALREEMAVSA